MHCLCEQRAAQRRCAVARLLQLKTWLEQAHVEQLQQCVVDLAVEFNRDSSTAAEWTVRDDDARHISATGMLFVPSIGGISQDFAENSREEDIPLVATCPPGQSSSCCPGIRLDDD